MPEAETEAPVIPEIGSDRLRLTDCRRLTGPGLLWDRVGAVVDVAFSGIAPDTVSGLWRLHARRMLDAVGWGGEQVTVRLFAGGANLVLSAPPDLLDTATIVAEAAWHFCAAELLGREPAPLQAMLDEIAASVRAEGNPALAALWFGAERRGLDCLVDDEALTLGHGRRSRTWPVGDLPAAEQVDWQGLGNIPVALITGTNGKTTTTRLCAAIASAAGLVAGLTSTDFIRVGAEIIDKGDWSGPGGARLLLRDRRVEAAFLEVARGGILRRGLPLRQAKAAAVLNVAADHLGEYGVTTVAELAEAKFAVRRALGPDGVLVLNADDPVVAEAERLGVEGWWFSLRDDAPQVDRRTGAWVEGGAVWLAGERVIGVGDIPVSMDGAAGYNVQNALAAVLLTRALGIGVEAMRVGLAGFHNDTADNPGRGNEFRVKGARVFVDFAHNPHSIAAVTGALRGMEAKRRFVMLSHAGDRSDQDIRDLTLGALALGADYVVAAELDGYLRGRKHGEVTALIRQAAADSGVAEERILRASSPFEGAKMVLEMAEPGDLALLCVHAERERVFELLRGAGEG